jgi:hypothetical protein
MRQDVDDEMKANDVMTSEQLVQRFVDQELSPEERVRFVARLGRDEALRQRAIELEQLVLDASRLPKPIASDQFIANVMERTAPAAPIWRKLADTLWTPRDFQWNLAGAAACLASIVVAGAIGWRLIPFPAAPVSSNSAGAIAAATDSSTVLVRLVIFQPDAQTVQVAGDFNGWNPGHTSLEQISTGAWAVTIPLKPGRFEYMFVVDGQKWIADPFAAEQSDDGFGSRNAVLDVQPPLGAQS